MTSIFDTIFNLLNKVDKKNVYGPKKSILNKVDMTCYRPIKKLILNKVNISFMKRKYLYYNLVGMTCFWDNQQQVHSKSKYLNLRN